MEEPVFFSKIKRLSLLVFFMAIPNQTFSLEESEWSPLTDKKLDVPIREFSVIISNEGFYPKYISAYAGEKVRFYVTSITDQPSCFLMNDKGLAVSVKKGKMKEVEAYFEKSGEFVFHCPTGRMFGKLAILNKPSAKKMLSKENQPKRNLASEKGMSEVKVWKPKDE